MREQRRNERARESVAQESGEYRADSKETSTPTESAGRAQRFTPDRQHNFVERSKNVARLICEHLNVPFDRHGWLPDYLQNTMFAIDEESRKAALATAPLEQAGTFDVRAWLQKDFPSALRDAWVTRNLEMVERAYAAGQAAAPATAQLSEEQVNDARYVLSEGFIPHATSTKILTERLNALLRQPAATKESK